MKTYSYTFDGSGTDTWILTGGNYFEILDATAGLDVEFLKRGSSIDETAENVQAGFSSKPPAPADGSTAFDTVRINSDSAQTVQVAISRGSGQFNRVVGTVSVDDGSAFDNFDDVAATAGAATQVLDTDTTRKGAVVYNGDAATTLRLGGSGVTATSGHPVGPGQSFTVPGGGAVYVYNPGAADVTVSGVTY